MKQFELEDAVPEFELEDAVPLTTKDTAPPKETPKRVSNPIKQAVAGVTDIATGIPAIAGLAGAGMQAGYNYLTDDEDKDYMEHFGSAIDDDGIDSKLLNAGVSAREGVNDFLDIKDPVSTEDQMARLAAGFLPIPGFALLSGASKLGNIAKGTANILLPTVRTGKGGAAGFARRGAAQLGIGIAADQGIRSYVDSPELPLMFSEQALNGVEYEIEDAEPIDEIALDTDIMAGNDASINKLIKLDRDMQANADWEETKDWMTTAGMLIAAGIGGRVGHKQIMKKYGSYSDYGNHIHSTMVDKSTALEESLKKLGVQDDQISKVIHNSHSNPTDMGIEALETGKLGQDFVPANGKKLRSWHELNGKYLELGDNKTKFDEGMLASIERAQRHNDPVMKDRLWKGARSNSELDATIEGARRIPEVKKLMDDMAENFEVLLDYQKWRGVLSDVEVTKFRNGAKLPDGRIAYMPLYNPSPETFLQRMAKNYLGVETKQGRDASLLAEYRPRDANVAEDVLTPLDALRRYTVSTIAHANENSYKANVLDRLTQIGRSASGIAGRKTDAAGKMLPTAKDTQYIGVVKNFDDPDSLPVEVLGDASIGRKFRNMTLADMKSQFPDEIVTAHYGGELRVYHVPDKGLRAALELNPQLGRMLQTMSHWKNVFIRGTTGNLSVFAPMSSLYSTQQIALNAAARDGLLSGIASVGRSFKGVGQLALQNGARDISNYMVSRLAKSFGDAPPAMLQKLQHRLARGIANSTLTQIRTESGRTVTGMGNVGTGTFEEVMDAFGKPAIDFFGRDEAALVGNLWKSWNNAWHEGPAYGAMMKKIGDVRNAGEVVTPQVIRDAVDISKTMAGDMRRVGSSRFAQAFGASVPFSGAMVQSWNSLGSAAKHNPTGFMMGASALIGIPTVSEMFYNNSISEGSEAWEDSETGKMWTYNDYYWNGYTTQQRIDNQIIMLPGKPPWEALLVPISPEWSLFRSVVIESADALFGLSAVGNMGENVIGDLEIEQAKVNRSHFILAGARVLDIPLPPLLAAAGSFVGADVQFGLATEYSPDPDNPGLKPTIIRKVPLGQGERITRRGGMTREADGHLSTTFTAMLQDIFGAAASTYVNVHEAVHSELSKKDGSLSGGIDRGLDALGSTLKSQARYTQSLFDKAVHPKINDEITSAVFASKRSLQSLADQMSKGFIGAGFAYSDGRLIEGNTALPSDDPITLELAASAKGILNNIKVFDTEYNVLKKATQSIPNATDLGSEKDKRNKLDGTILKMQSLKAQQLAIIQQFERELSKYLTNRYGRDVEIDFINYASRPNLPEGSGMQELLNSPRTAQ